MTQTIAQRIKFEIALDRARGKPLDRTKLTRLAREEWLERVNPRGVDRNAVTFPEKEEPK